MAKWTSQTVEQDIAAFSDDPKVKKAIRRRLLRVIMVVLVSISIVGFGAKPAYKWIRAAQIDRNLEEAKAAVRSEDWGRASRQARSVMLARPGDFEAYCCWFEAMSHLGDPRTYIIAAGLFMDPRATDTDRLKALKIMALQAPQAVTLSAYASLSKEMREDPAALAAMSPLLTYRGETALVEKVLRATSTLATNPAVRLELIRALCSRPTAERVAEARTIFADLIKAEDSQPALDALVILGQVPKGLAPGSPLPPLQEWVNRQPKATTLQHLLALHPDLEENPAAAESVFQAAINRFLAVDPGVLGDWLIRHNQAARAADILVDSARTNSDAFIARINALLREKRIAEITTALATPPTGCDLVDLHLVKVAVAHLQRDAGAETNAWNAALHYASFDQSRNRFLEIAQYAQLLGASDIVDDAWVAGIRIGWGRIPLYRDLSRVIDSLASHGRAEDLLAVCRTLLRFEPQNPFLINNFYYVALLLKVTPPATAAGVLENLIDTYPKATEFRSALAMAYLMEDKPELALQQIPFLKESKRLSPQMCRALEGSALLLAGRTDEGRTLMRDIDWNVFMISERTAFRYLLARLDLKNLPLPAPELPKSVPDPDSVPAWRKAVDCIEKDRANDVLPSLPPPRIPGFDRDTDSDRDIPAPGGEGR